MIYPAGHPVTWRDGIKARAGSLHGTLSRPWHRYERENNFPWIIWDGETDEKQTYPECITPKPFNAWAEHKPERKVAR